MCFVFVFAFQFRHFTFLNIWEVINLLQFLKKKKWIKEWHLLSKSPYSDPRSSILSKLQNTYNRVAASHAQQDLIEPDL